MATKTLPQDVTHLISISLFLVTTLTLASGQYPPTGSILRRPTSLSGQQLQYQPIRVSNPRRLTASQQVKLQQQQRLASQRSGLVGTSPYRPQTLSRTPHSMLSRPQPQRAVTSQAGRLALSGSRRYVSPLVNGNRYVSAGSALNTRLSPALAPTLGQQQRYYIPRSSLTLPHSLASRQRSAPATRTATPTRISANTRILTGRQTAGLRPVSRAPVRTVSNSPRVLRVMSSGAYQQLLRQQSLLRQRRPSSTVPAQTLNPQSQATLMLQRQQQEIAQQLQRLQAMIEQQQQPQQQQPQQPAMASTANDTTSQTAIMGSPNTNDNSVNTANAAAQSPPLAGTSGAAAGSVSDNMIVSNANLAKMGAMGKGSDLLGQSAVMENTVVGASAKPGDQMSMEQTPHLQHSANNAAATSVMPQAVHSLHLEHAPTGVAVENPFSFQQGGPQNPFSLQQGGPQNPLNVHQGGLQNEATSARVAAASTAPAALVIPAADPQPQPAGGSPAEVYVETNPQSMGAQSAVPPEVVVTASPAMPASPVVAASGPSEVSMDQSAHMDHAGSQPVVPTEHVSASVGPMASTHPSETLLAANRGSPVAPSPAEVAVETLVNTEPVLSSVPVQPALNSAPVQTVMGSMPIQPALNSAPIQPTMGSAPIQPAMGSTPIQPALNLAPIQPTMGSAPIQPSMGSAPVQPAQNLAPIQPTMGSAPVQPSAASGDTAQVMSAPSPGSTAPVMSSAAVVPPGPAEVFVEQPVYQEQPAPSSSPAAATAPPSVVPAAIAAVAAGPSDVSMTQSVPQPSVPIVMDTAAAAANVMPTSAPVMTTMSLMEALMTAAQTMDGHPAGSASSAVPAPAMPSQAPAQEEPGQQAANPRPTQITNPDPSLTSGPADLQPEVAGSTADLELLSVMERLTRQLELFLTNPHPHVHHPPSPSPSPESQMGTILRNLGAQNSNQPINTGYMSETTPPTSPPTPTPTPAATHAPRTKPMMKFMIPPPRTANIPTTAPASQTLTTTSNSTSGGHDAYSEALNVLPMSHLLDPSLQNSAQKPSAQQYANPTPASIYSALLSDFVELQHLGAQGEFSTGAVPSSSQAATPSAVPLVGPAYSYNNVPTQGPAAAQGSSPGVAAPTVDPVSETLKAIADLLKQHPELLNQMGLSSSIGQGNVSPQHPSLSAESPQPGMGHNSSMGVNSSQPAQVPNPPATELPWMASNSQPSGTSIWAWTIHAPAVHDVGSAQPGWSSVFTSQQGTGLAGPAVQQSAFGPNMPPGNSSQAANSSSMSQQSAFGPNMPPGNSSQAANSSSMSQPQAFAVTTPQPSAGVNLDLPAQGTNNSVASNATGPAMTQPPLPFDLMTAMQDPIFAQLMEAHILGLMSQASQFQPGSGNASDTLAKFDLQKSMQDPVFVQLLEDHLQQLMLEGQTLFGTGSTSASPNRNTTTQPASSTTTPPVNTTGIPTTPAASSVFSLMEAVKDPAFVSMMENYINNVMQQRQQASSNTLAIAPSPTTPPPATTASVVANTQSVRDLFQIFSNHTLTPTVAATLPNITAHNSTLLSNNFFSMLKSAMQSPKTNPGTLPVVSQATWDGLEEVYYMLQYLRPSHPSVLEQVKFLLQVNPPRAKPNPATFMQVTATQLNEVGIPTSTQLQTNAVSSSINVLADVYKLTVGQVLQLLKGMHPSQIAKVMTPPTSVNGTGSTLTGMNAAGTGLNTAGTGVNAAGTGLNTAGTGMNAAGTGMNVAGIGIPAGSRAMAATTTTMMPMMTGEPTEAPEPGDPGFIQHYFKVGSKITNDQVLMLQEMMGV